MSFALELDTLPKKARGELIEYYEFLVSKYCRKLPPRRAKKTVVKFKAFLTAPIRVNHFVMPDREARNAR